MHRAGHVVFLRIFFGSAGLIAWGPVLASDPEPDRPRPVVARPDLTDPVICDAIRGFRDFEPRDRPTLQPDEKLQIYYEPFNYTIARDGKDGQYHAHLVEDAKLRRAGSDRVLFTLVQVVEYEPEADEPPSSCYLATAISLKEIPDGSFELDLVLRDALAEGKAIRKVTVPFRVDRTEADFPER